MREQKNKAREIASQKLIETLADYTATEAERRLVATMLMRHDREIRAAINRMPAEKRYQPCDLYFDLAERRRQCRGNDEVNEVIHAFAWYLNDRATDSRERERVRVYRKCPPYGAAIARQRARGRVPIPVGGYHVTIAFQPQYRMAAPSRDLCLLVLPNAESETYDYRFLAGLNVLILATGDEYEPAIWLTRSLACDGVESVHVRMLNHPMAGDVQLFPGRGLSWDK